MLELDLLFRGGAVGLFLLIATILFRTGGPQRLFAPATLCGAAYLLAASAPIAEILGPAQPALLAAATTGPFWFALAARRAFGAAVVWRAGPMVGVALGLAALALAANVSPAPASALLWTLLNLTFLACFSAAMAAAWRGLSDDLDPPRRTQRLLVLVAGAAFGLVVTALAVFTSAQGAPRWLREGEALFVAMGSFGLALWFALGLVRSKEPAIRPKTASTSPSALARKITDALQRDRLYRRPDLSVAMLAGALAAPEHHVRQAINADLGAVNFREFINGYRLQDVTLALSDPNQAAVPIATIALDAGFGSIATFNRVFKAAKGVSPSEFRRQALPAAAQNDELSSQD